MYKIIGIQPTHKKMKEMLGSTMYGLVEKPNGYKPTPIIITGILIGKYSKWSFQFDYGTMFEDNEPIFYDLLTLKRYCRHKKIKLV